MPLEARVVAARAGVVFGLGMLGTLSYLIIAEALTRAGGFVIHSGSAVRAAALSLAAGMVFYAIVRYVAGRTKAPGAAKPITGMRLLTAGAIYCAGLFLGGLMRAAADGPLSLPKIMICVGLAVGFTLAFVTMIRIAFPKPS